MVFAFAVCDGDAECFLLGGCVGILELEGLPCADESSRCVFCECSGEEVGFGEDLKSVADSYNQCSFCCLLFEGRDDGFASGERACSEVISPGETAGQEDSFCFGGEACCGAIDEGWGMGGELAERGEEVLFAVGAGEA